MVTLWPRIRGWGLASVLAWLGAMAAGCGEAGSFELIWAIGRIQATLPSCPVTSALTCSRAGIDAVEVRVLRGSSEEDRSLFPCYSQGEGGVGRGPDLDEGAVVLQAACLGPGGQRLSDPVKATAVIPQSGLYQVQVVLNRPRQCNDGVDNDGDGLVDPMDPECPREVCDNGLDDDGDALADGKDDDCPESDCSDGKDNDSDGKTDKDDPGCTKITSEYKVAQDSCN